jgi:hypothetical protein
LRFVLFLFLTFSRVYRNMRITEDKRFGLPSCGGQLLMGIFSSPPAPYVPPLPAAPSLPPAPAQPTDRAASDAAQATQARARAAAGFAGTIATSGQGVTAPTPLSLKTLLGQ